jgi:hypothetical protein
MGLGCRLVRCTQCELEKVCYARFQGSRVETKGVSSSVAKIGRLCPPLWMHRICHPNLNSTGLPLLIPFHLCTLSNNAMSSNDNALIPRPGPAPRVSQGPQAGQRSLYHQRVLDVSLGPLSTLDLPDRFRRTHTPRRSRPLSPATSSPTSPISTLPMPILPH